MSEHQLKKVFKNGFFDVPEGRKRKKLKKKWKKICVPYRQAENSRSIIIKRVIISLENFEKKKTFDHIL